MQGFIYLHRKILKWEWYDDANTMRVFLHLLLTANHIKKRWRGIDIKRGQVVIGRKKLASTLKLTEREIRTSLKRLKSTNELTIKTTNKFSVVSIAEYESYQVYEKKTTSKTTSQVPTNDQQTTTTNNDNNDNKNNKKETFEIPEWINVNDWNDFLKMRSSKPGVKNTEFALSRIIAKLDRMRQSGNDPNIGLQESIMNNWTGVFEPKQQKGKVNGKTGDELLREIRERRLASGGNKAANSELAKLCSETEA